MSPNNNRNVICGWTNYSGMVIAYEMNENEMDYRVSKSNVIDDTNIFVKEQRADGGYYWLTYAKKQSIIKVCSNGWWKSVSSQNPF